MATENVTRRNNLNPADQHTYHVEFDDAGNDGHASTDGEINQLAERTLQLARSEERLTQTQLGQSTFTIERRQYIFDQNQNRLVPRPLAPESPTVPTQTVEFNDAGRATVSPVTRDTVGNVLASPNATPSPTPEGSSNTTPPQAPAESATSAAPATTSTNRGMRGYVGPDLRLNFMDFPLGQSATGYQAGAQGTLEVPLTTALGRPLDLYVNGGAGYLAANGNFTARNGQSATHNYSGLYTALGAGVYFRPAEDIRLGLGLELQYRFTNSSDSTPSDHTSPTGMSVDDCVNAGLGQQQCAQAASGATHMVQSGRDGALVTNGGRLSARPGSSPMIGGALVVSADLAIPFLPRRPLSVGGSFSLGRYNVSPADFTSYGVTEYSFGVHADLPLQSTAAESTPRSSVVNLSTPVTLSGDTLTIPRSLVGRAWPTGVSSIFVDGERQDSIHVPTGNEALQIPAGALSQRAASHTIVFKNAEGHELLNIGFRVNDTRATNPPRTDATPRPPEVQETETNNGPSIVVGVGTLDRVETNITRPQTVFDTTTGVMNSVRVADFIVPGNVTIPQGTSLQVRIDGQDVGNPVTIPAQTADANREETALHITLPANRLTPAGTSGVLTDGSHSFQILLNIADQVISLRQRTITIHPPYAHLSGGQVQPAPGTRHTNIFARDPVIVHFHADQNLREGQNVSVTVGDYHQDLPVRRVAGYEDLYSVSIVPLDVFRGNHNNPLVYRPHALIWEYSPPSIRIRDPRAPDNEALSVTFNSPNILRARGRRRP